MNRIGAQVLGAFIDAGDWTSMLARIDGWAEERCSRYVCICNVHSVVTAFREEQLRAAINGADLATPDGMPVAWLLRKCGYHGQQRINGPDLMWRYCKLAARSGRRIYLYGSTTRTLCRLEQRLLGNFTNLNLVGSYSPPFRTMTPEEDADVVKQINETGAEVVFVGLGCPRQEVWMSMHRGSIQAVMIGVGAAFDYHAGVLKRAPQWIQNAGLEWLFRLMSEPRRLWRRYFGTNIRFLYYLVIAKVFRSRR